MSTDALATLEKITGKKLTLGLCIWAIRTSEEESQVAFAHKLGVSRQYLCDLEHGRKSVSPKKAKDFAEKLGFSAEQFIRLALQDTLHQSGMHFNLKLTKKAK
jgi:transcriptional regulator with XRE-family HTH domain